MEKVAFEFEKGDKEMIRARISEFSGQTRADLRIFFKTENGEWYPTKRGISFPVDLMGKMKEAISKLEEESREAIKK